MNSGILRNRITLQSPVNTANGQGGFVTTWTDERTVWAAIWPTSAKERVEAMQMGLNTTHRIIIRYWPGVASSWRVKFGTRYFNILGIINHLEVNRLLDLTCEEAQ
jgi:SPP1 family predicted phage head-tail adaptor